MWRFFERGDGSNSALGIPNSHTTPSVGLRNPLNQSLARSETNVVATACASSRWFKVSNPSTGPGPGRRHRGALFLAGIVIYLRATRATGRMYKCSTATKATTADAQDIYGLGADIARSETDAAENVGPSGMCGATVGVSSPHERQDHFGAHGVAGGRLLRRARP
ncbi:MAG: hypothetical protein ABJA82_18530 [Myxococcales bacterium]